MALVAVIALVMTLLLTRGGGIAGGSPFDDAMDAMDWDAAELNGRMYFRYVDVAQYRDAEVVKDGPGRSVVDLAVPYQLAQPTPHCSVPRDQLRSGIGSTTEWSVVSGRMGIVSPGRGLFDAIEPALTGEQCGMTRSGDVLSGGNGPVPAPRAELTDGLLILTQAMGSESTFERGRGDVFGADAASALRTCIGDDPMIVTMLAPAATGGNVGSSNQPHTAATALVTSWTKGAGLTSRVCLATDGDTEAVKTALEARPVGPSGMKPENITVDGSVVLADLVAGPAAAAGEEPIVRLHGRLPDETGFLF